MKTGVRCARTWLAHRAAGLLAAGLLLSGIALAGVSEPVTVDVPRSSTSFIVIGDWGAYGNDNQQAVAARMNALAAQRPVDFIVSTGDNIYDEGVESVDDPLFKQTFEDIYDLEHIRGIDWYLVLGNHDYQGNYRAQIEYSEINSRWNLPATYHALRVRFDGAREAILLFTDTNPLIDTYRERPKKYRGVNDQDVARQLAWVGSTLAGHAGSTWKILVGHHPAYSGGRYKGANQSLQPLVGIMEKERVHAYFSGHDHDLQHLKPPGAVHYFVSGAGAKRRPTGESEHTVFGVSERGFAYVTLTAASMTVEFIGVDGAVLHRADIQRAPQPPADRSISYEGASAVFEDDRLVLENDRIARTYAWNGGDVVSLSIEDKRSGQLWKLRGESPDFSLGGERQRAEDGRLTFHPVEATSITPAHLQVRVYVRFGRLEVQRVCRVFSATPAIACDIHLRGQAESDWATAGRSPDSRGMLEADTPIQASADVVADRLRLEGRHWSVRTVRFSAATDHNDTLVAIDATELYRKDQRLSGNLLLLEHRLNGRQLFVLKEAPATRDQLYYPGYDFTVGYEDVRVNGLGVGPADIEHGAWARGYGTVVGVADRGELALLDALRSHQDTSRLLQPGRDHMILMNTWGDRGRDGKMSEEFAIRELEAGAKLGITHLQLDDGWQAGLSANSASSEGRLWDNWSAGAWQPHPVRFPNGLQPVVDKAAALGMQVGLWFNPSAAGSYANWERDAGIVIDLYRRHGIRTYKIDGIEVRDKQAETNLRKLFDKVVAGTDGQVIFNLDVTAGVRPGYHFFGEYGNIFLENRYTDWANYYPHRTLRNLWMLSRYVPPQRLQIEFLNKWRNADKYLKNDPLAPANVPFDYVFAVTMMAQPLAWMEGTGLPDAGLDIAPLIQTYRRLQTDLHRGRIFPIGDRPDGTGWTGFQSMQEGRGYVLVFRELNERATATVSTWFDEGADVDFTPALGHGGGFRARVGKHGAVDFSLPREHTFALYRYRIR